MKMMNNDIVLFETKDKEIKLSVSVDNDTVWLSANQMALLFDRDEKTIRKHIADKRYLTKIYNLDMILSVGYRVNSKRGIAFRYGISKSNRSLLKRGRRNEYFR